MELELCLSILSPLLRPCISFRRVISLSLRGGGKWRDVWRVGKLLRGKEEKEMEDASLSLTSFRKILTLFHDRHQEGCHQVVIHTHFTLSRHLRNRCFFCSWRLKDQIWVGGMFVGYNLVHVGLSQTHCILHTCAVFLPCFSQGFILLFKAPEMPGYNHFLSGILKILLCSLDTYCFPARLV